MCFCLCKDLFNCSGLAATENVWPYSSSVVGLDYICISSLTDDYYRWRSSQFPCTYLFLLNLGMANLYVMYICSVNYIFNHQHFMHSTMEAYSVSAPGFYGVKYEYSFPSSMYACTHTCSKWDSMSGLSHTLPEKYQQRMFSFKTKTRICTITIQLCL